MKPYQRIVTILGVVLLLATFVIGGLTGAVDGGDMARILLICCIIAGVNWAVFVRKRR